MRLRDAVELQPDDAAEHFGRQREIGDGDDAAEQRRREDLREIRPQRRRSAPPDRPRLAARRPSS